MAALILTKGQRSGERALATSEEKTIGLTGAPKRASVRPILKE